MPTGSRSAALEFSGLTKAYGNLVVLDRFTHRFAPGRVHALMGKNGSGKSTLVKVLSGAVQPTAGTVHLDGTELSFASPADALAAGIATVYQELSIIPSLSIGENIYLGRLPVKRRLGVEVVDWDKLHAGAAALLHGMGLDLDPRRPAEHVERGPAAGDRDRQGDVVQSEDLAARRADLGSGDQGSRTALRLGSAPAGARRHDDLHHPSHE